MAFLNQLVQWNLLSATSRNDFLNCHADRLADYTTTERIGKALVAAGFLTGYQLERILSGAIHGLVLGNYRVLERLGGGSVGVVFLAEHIFLKRKVAMKTLTTDEAFPQSVLDRFYSEMRVLTLLDHPHIVMAYDAGVLPPADRGQATLHYLAMELMEGDLEQYVYDHGILSVPQACEWMRQVASGLQQAHDHHLIHRDLKPSNLLRNELNQVKIVDFGLAREFTSNRTAPRSLLGSIEFMPPEQSINPTTVRSAADIYSLGATLFWLITGHTPFPRETSVADSLYRLQHEQPRHVRDFEPAIPAELDRLIAQMIDRDPDQRPGSAREVMQAMARFAAPGGSLVELDAVSWGEGVPTASTTGSRLTKPPQVLIVDADDTVRSSIRAALEPLQCICHEASEGVTAMEMLHDQPIDLILVDLTLPGLHGYDVCHELRTHPPRAHLKIIVMAGTSNPDELAIALQNGADDFLTKPLRASHVCGRVLHAVRMKAAQDQVDQLTRHMLSANKQLEHSLHARENDVKQAEDALFFAMAKMAEIREGGTPGHLRRLQKYCAAIAEKLRGEPTWGGLLDRRFVENMERCVLLHDIGKVGLPDELVLKNGPLTPEERRIMESHTVIGSDLIDAIGKEYGQSLEFLGLARALIRHHHERFDGRGYPDRLAGDDIPPVARIMTAADVYDSLRRHRPHRPALSHAQSIRVILFESQGVFDPTVLRAVAAAQDEFQRIYDTVS
jgi:response regulator RpfG family c-di-GMP phosphodiesterase